ncbi:transketolase [bacterium]|nr:transketolase [bacterium]|tara:strand:+ start:7619 stop:8611 length:993 start_codon:yes stop_codon:yes gene_type:complete
MLNSKVKLSRKIFGKDVEMIPTRDGYGDGLVMAGEKNDDVVVLTADLADSTRAQAFAEKFPERFFECGVAEQAMATVAAGLGTSGKIPFISSYATFSPGRNWEQIRTSISYNDSNVKIAGHHSGISVGPDGVTHQAVEDIATMRVMANMTVIQPCDAIEARKATIQAAKVWGPMYLRFSREKTAVLTSDTSPFTIGRAEVLWEEKGAKVLIIGCGPLLHHALLAAKELKKEKVPVVVLNSHTIKPLDAKTILPLAKKIGAVLTVEEHQVHGGLGGAVAELLARECPVPIEFIGMQDTFAESGPPDELWNKYGMGVEDIKRAVNKVLKRKR